MQSTHTRLAGSIAAAVASAAAGFYLWPATHSASTSVADRNAATEVRTQVIHRTVHVVRHQKAKPGAAQPVELKTHTAAATGTRSGTHAASTPVHTGSSQVGTSSNGVHPLVSTRTSATGTSSTSGSAPVRTSSSPSGSGSEVGDDGGESDGGGDD